MAALFMGAALFQATGDWNIPDILATTELARLGQIEARYSYASWTAPSHYTFMMGLVPHTSPLGFAPTVVSDQLGVASATKMCRSVMIKGLEAMVIESFTTARHYGVEDAVIESLQETFPGIDWEAQGAYFFQRVIEHGRRRSEEVREVAQTVREVGLVPWSAEGTAERQAWVADLADVGLFGRRGAPGFARSRDWRTEADRILAHLQKDDDGIPEDPRLA